MPTAVQAPAPVRLAPRPPAARTHRRATGTIVRRTHPMWFLAPAFAILVLFFLLPTLFNFIYAFTDWSGFKTAIKPVGFGNFADLASDGTLFRSLRITVEYAVLVAVFQNLFGFLLAVLLERDNRLNRIARVFLLIPVLMSALAVGYIF